MAKNTAVSARQGRSAPPPVSTVSPELRQRMIREAAYYRSLHRGFAPGHDMDDWLAAEANFEWVSRRRVTAETEKIEEFGMQGGSTLGPAEDDALKRALKRHPGRDIPLVESMEPSEAPPKE